MNLKQLLKLGLGFSCAVYFLSLVLQQFNFKELLEILSRSDKSYLFLALLAFLSGYACRIARWRSMLSHNNPFITWRQCAGPLMASFAANNVLPFRAGDAMRSFLFSEHLGVNSSAVLATLLVERLLDLLMVLVLFSLSLVFFQLDLESLSRISGYSLLVLSALILTVLLFPSQWAACFQVKHVKCLNARYPFLTTLLAGLENALNTLIELAQWTFMGRLILWSMLVWIAEGGVYYFAALSITDLSFPSASWLALPLGTLATLVPSTPGYLGTFDYAIMRGMTALHNAPVSATAYALSVHLLLWLPATVLGGAYLSMQTLRQFFSKRVFS